MEGDHVHDEKTEVNTIHAVHRFELFGVIDCETVSMEGDHQ